MSLNGSCGQCIKRNLLFCFGITPMCETQCCLLRLPANTRRWPSAGPILAHRPRRWLSIKTALLQRFVFAGLRSIAASLVVLTAGGDYKPTPNQCLLNVGPASPVLASIHSALVSTSCWPYRHDTLIQSCVTVGLLFVTLAHIQRGAKHDTVTQYWANVGSALSTVGQH